MLTQYGADERLISHRETGLSPARIISQQRNLYRIVTETEEATAEVSGRYRYTVPDPTGYPAVGDYVLVDPITNGHTLIQQLLPRKSVFLRRAAGTGGGAQVVAANIDVVFLCMSLNQNFNLSRLERYLSVAWESGATPVVVLTKSDLCDNSAELLAQIAPIAIGAEMIVTSDRDPDTREKLLAYVKPGVTAAFVGSSGVGKSTLINLLLGEIKMRTSGIGLDDRGHHTTTHREMLPLPTGGVVIDTPGMRELGVEAVDLSRSFADIDELAAQCRFSDCSHTREPGCAVRRALETGALDERRYENYQKLRREARYDGLNARAREAEKINAMFGGKRAMKQVMDEAKRKNGRR
ncbi:MAG: ribosome small subunit-dependent GTPase A [Eubacteriales bacterium]|nr:ribosome small subunit-dependent GTPase A [Eubacteriales bacterium]